MYATEYENTPWNTTAQNKNLTYSVPTAARVIRVEKCRSQSWDACTTRLGQPHLTRKGER